MIIDGLLITVVLVITLLNGTPVGVVPVPSGMADCKSRAMVINLTSSTHKADCTFRLAVHEEE